jgi:KaiC/GvpD/RAD55 family RecA-like ATPase/ABC-type glycerol-3-phosphate transport system substrate-binding protein
MKSISTGTEGLDKLLPVSEEKGSFGIIAGESILVAGPPGTGKTLMGLQFLLAGKNAKKIYKEDKSLWISFEGGKDGLYKSIGDIESGIGEMVANEDGSDFFNFKYFAPATINLDELVYVINCFLEQGVNRIVIDSISDLIAVFKDRLEFKNFINSFLQILHEKGATTMLLYRVSNFFGSPETLGIEVTSIVDTILLLKNVEAHNKIERGIFVLKIRGRKHRSEIQPVIISKEKGLEIRKLGWSTEGLLSGSVGEIHEPEIFIKIFYENEAEDKINREGAKEFQDRYPTGRVIVTFVRKPGIHIDFWSFREERGPSHSNVKIVSVKKYWAGGFIERERLYALGNYIPEETKKEKENEEFWKECLATCKKVGKRDKTEDIYLIPYYADINVLTYRKDIFEKLREDKEAITWKDILEFARDNYEIEIIPDSPNNLLITWDNLIKFAKKLINNLPEEERPPWCFAMPYLDDKSSFMAFFLEILWAYGGNIFKIPDELKLDGKKIEKEKATLDDLGRYVLANLDDEVLGIKKPEAVKALEVLRDWVFDENKKCSPNPYEGNFSCDALFSMQWYSKIKNTLSPIKRDEIGIAAPPVGPNNKKCYIAYDLCCLALIKGAIAPEMGWLFIDALASTKNMREMAEGKLGLPAREEAYYYKEFVNFDEEANEIAKKFILEKQENYEWKTLSKIPYYYRIESIIYREIKNVFHPNHTKRKAPKDALDNAYDSIKEFLEEKKEEER